MPKEKKGILFVCLGNICRSTMAEGIFNNVIKERGVQDQWIVDSAATSTYQIGNPPDERAKKVMRKHHMTMDHRARQITAEDFTKFKYIFGMDKENVRDLKSVKPPGSESEILMLGKYDPETKNGIIEDPYFESGQKPFETVFEQCLRSCNNFLDSLPDS